jgi:hypothetical protein
MGALGAPAAGFAAFVHCGTKRPTSGLSDGSMSNNIVRVGMSLSPTELIASYRLHAAQCIEIARDLEPDRKLALLNIAQAWLNLAEQVAKNLDTVLVYETPVSSPDLK